MTHKIFIDGGSGTTALALKQVLLPFIDKNIIQLIEISDPKNIEQRQQASLNADLVILCLPDAVAKQTIPFLEQHAIRTIDASSAHRAKPLTDRNWAYGFPELSDTQPDKIRNAQFVTNPGCYATGALTILKPLIEANIIDANHAIQIVGVAGYTTGGKKLINKHNDTKNDDFNLSHAYAQYSIAKPHRHIEEIQNYSGLKTPPIFTPSIISIPRGMLVSISFNQASMPHDMHETLTLKRVQKALQSYYSDPTSMIRVEPFDTKRRTINFDDFTDLNNGKAELPIDHLKLVVTGWDDYDHPQITVHAILDNLGKGAATQALQNMKLMLKI